MSRPLASVAVAVAVAMALVAMSASASAGLVTLPDGRRMYLECRGSGSPTVILGSGAGNGADIWSLRLPGSHKPEVFPAVARFTRVRAYDRPGVTLQGGALSRSDPVPCRGPWPPMSPSCTRSSERRASAHRT